MNYTQLASEMDLQKAANAVKNNGFQVFIANTKEEAKKLALKLIPDGAEVMTNTSITLEETGIKNEIDKSGNYISLHNKLLSMNRETEQIKMKEIRSVPEYALGSAHAVTLDGSILIASGSGSQIPGYAYGANQVILIIGTHKIVKNIDSGIKRIYEHSLPLESKRANKAYNITSGSSPRRILILNSESDINKGRTTIIFLKEAIGF